MYNKHPLAGKYSVAITVHDESMDDDSSIRVKCDDVDPQHPEYAEITLVVRNKVRSLWLNHCAGRPITSIEEVDCYFRSLIADDLVIRNLVGTVVVKRAERQED